MASAPVSINQPLITAEQFAAMADDRLTELVAGRIIELTSPKSLHGRVVAQIIYLLKSFIHPKKLGWVWGAESGIITTRNPDSVRGVDVIYASYQRIPQDQFPDGSYCETPPELVFEVLSPDDRWPDVLEKTLEYLTAGINVVCLVEPELKLVYVYRSDRGPETLRVTDTFTLSDILGDFSVPVSEFFE